MQWIYKEVIQGSDIGYAHYEVIFDSHDTPCDYKCIEVNKAFEEYANLKAKDIIGGKNNCIFSDTTDNEIDWIEYYGKIATNGGKREYEKHVESTNRWYKIQVFSPKEYHFVITCVDITELKDLSKKIKSSESILKQVIDSIPSRIFWKDKNLKYLGFNKSFAQYAGPLAKYAGIPIEKMVGKDDFEMGWVDFEDSYRKDDKQVIETGLSKLNSEDKIMTARGKTKWIKTSKIALYDSDKDIYGLLGISEDITEQKELEESLQMGKLRDEQLASKSNSVAWEINKEGLFTYISPVCEKVFGYSSAEVVNKMYIYNSFNLEGNYKELVLSMINRKKA
jgi:PAS domain S-box-containing protein